MASYGLLKRDGSYDFNAVQIVFDTYQIPPERRARYLEQTVMVIELIEKKREAERAGR